MIISRRISMSVVLPGILLPALCAQLALADGADQGPSQALQEVVVTATRRAEVESKVPISITAFTQEKMDINNVRSVDDIAKMTPGVQFNRTNDEGAIADISIRGIQSNAGAGTNGVYIDDTPIQTRQDLGGLGSSVWPAIFDLERVEVLRGPQGTLFGSGSMGGAIRLITPQPSTTRTAVYARSDFALTQGGDPSVGLGVAVNLPLIDNKLGVRFSGSYAREGGLVDRYDYWNQYVIQPRADFNDIKTFRVAFAYQPTENLTITPSIYWQKVYNNDSGNYWLMLSNPSEGKYVRYSNMPDQTTDRFVIPALKVQWDLGKVSLFSNTSYFDRNQPGAQDLAAFEAAIWANQFIPPKGMYAPSFNITTQHVFTQEFRLQNSDPDSRLTWVFGVFYQKASQRFQEFVQDTFLPGLIQETFGKSFEEVIGSPLVDGKYTVIVDPWDTVDKHLAGFGQVDYKITDKLKATLGLRAEQAKLSSLITYSGPINGPVPITFIASGKETPVTPKYGLSYQMNPGTLLYATAAKGYRIGGTNQPIAINCGNDLKNIGLDSEPQTYASDSLWSYELGSKFRSSDGRFAIDGSVYLIKWKNLQVNYNLPTCGFSFTTNAGAITSKGFELSMQARPIDQVDLGLAVGYTTAATDNTYYYGGGTTPSVPGEQDIVSKGDRQMVAPWTVAFFGQYTFDAFQHKSYFRLNYNYADGLNHGLASMDPNSGNYDPALKGLPVRQDMGVRLGSHFGGFDVALFCNNLLNEHPLLGYSHSISSDPIFTAHVVRPRTVGITAIYRY